jgi:ABC-type glycerol-3-phosphate transport system substrate-binding protein
MQSSQGERPNIEPASADDHGAAGQTRGPSDGRSDGRSRRDFLRTSGWGIAGWGATWLAGCRPTATPSGGPSEPEEPLELSQRLMVVDDPFLAESIRRQWELRGEGDLEVVSVTSSELLADGSGPTTDGVIFPSGLLGEMVRNQWLLPFPEEMLQDGNLDWRGIFDSLRLREATWSRTVYGVPLGSPVFLLWYRTDEWSRLDLAPPRTWSEYLQAVSRLRDEWGDEAETAAALEPLAPGWGSQLLMARAAGYARSRSFLASWFDSITMKPLVDGPHFVRSLEEMAITSGGPAALEMTPSDVWERFVEGKTWTAVTWPTTRQRRSLEGVSATDPASTTPLARGSIGVSSLPGASQAYDRIRGTWSERAGDDREGQVTLLGTSGRLAAVTRRTTQQRATAALLGWLAGREWGEQVSSVSPDTTLYRGEHLARPNIWLPTELAEELGVPYAEAVQRALTRTAGVQSIRVPGRARYLAALDQAIAVTVRGEQSAEEALREAAARWQEITEDLGVDAQRVAYRESLNLQ